MNAQEREARARLLARIAAPILAVYVAQAQDNVIGPEKMHNALDLAEDLLGWAQRRMQALAR